MRHTIAFLVLSALVVCSPAQADSDKTIAVIGTGDMGDSLGPRLAELGYTIVYGSRDPARDSVQELLIKTGPNATATTQVEAAASADIVFLAVGWPAMREVAQNLGNLDGKIVIDVSFPFEQAEDGYPRSTVETSSAELIQSWNPGAKVVKISMPTAYYIDYPQELGARPSNLIAGNDRESKEVVARIAYELGQDPFDAGPLRMSRAIEAQTHLFMVPLYQRREASWENVTARTSYWSCVWGDDWSVPVADADNLAEFPSDAEPLKECDDYADRPVQLVARVAETQWQPCPPNLPAGCEVAVLEGDPQVADFFTVRFRVTDEFVMPPHTHPRDERVTIISGQVAVAFGEDAVREDASQFGPGDYYVNSRNAVHTVWADKPSVLQITGIGPWAADFVE